VIPVKDCGESGERTRFDASPNDGGLSDGGLWTWMGDGRDCESGHDTIFGFERLSQTASVHRDMVDLSIHHIAHNAHGLRIQKAGKLALQRSPLRRSKRSSPSSDQS
jgi:hypothetical protein